MKTQKQQVLEAVIELHNQEQPASRHVIADMLGLKQSSVDDCLKSLADDELIYRVCSGVYAPYAQHPPARIIYKAVLPDGTVKIDIGDDIVLTLTPKEARVLGSLFMAEATLHGQLALSHQIAQLNHHTHNRLKVLERSLPSD